jgi:hypothetical protein
MRVSPSEELASYIESSTWAGNPVRHALPRILNPESLEVKREEACAIKRICHSDLRYTGTLSEGKIGVLGGSSLASIGNASAEEFSGTRRITF